MSKTIRVYFGALHGATLDKGVPIAGPSDVYEIGEKAPPGVADAPVCQLRSTGARSIKKRLPARLLLSTYITPLERIRPSTSMMDLDLEGVLEIAHRWNLLK